jgi:polyvinyl alcohol dehydrogenase (cytochrome)
MPLSSARAPRGPFAPRLAAVIAMTALFATACAPRPDTTAAVRTETADAEHPGRAVYQEWCASCHDSGETSGGPSLAALRTLNQATVRYALELGYMKLQAQNVPKDDLEQLIDWLPRNEGASDAWVEEALCPIKRRQVRLDGAARTATTFGLGHDNQRNQTAEQSGLTKADMPGLELAWAVAFPNTPTMRAQPVIVGDTLFIAATDAGRLYALDADTGCVKWMYRSNMTLRSSLSFAEATDNSPPAIVMGDAGGQVHAVNALNGESMWVRDVKLTELNRITGAPVVLGDRVFAPLSAIEVNYTQFDDYECCRGQGAVIALDIATGETVWTGRTMEEAKPVLTGRTGTQQWGPSGAIIWSTPAIDVKRNLLYAGSGENTSWPATDTSDAIIAYDINTGERRWAFQATSADIWNYACGRRGANCDFPGEYHSPDFDFGGSAVIAKNSAGKDLVIAGQKSGVVWAIDPDNNGSLVWSNRVSRGSANGGVHWGVAFDGKRIYAPSNDRPSPGGHPNWGPGLHALDIDTGNILWSYKPTAADCGAEVPAGRTTRPAPGLEMTPIAAPMTPASRATWNVYTPPGGEAPAGPSPQRQQIAPPPAQQAAANGGEATPTPARPPAAPCRLGFSPAPLVIDGAVVQGTTQGMLYVFDGETGDVLFRYMTNRPYPDTVNGVEGQGGGLDSHPYVAARGTLYVQSGYARFGEPPGNVLLAFRPKK